MLPIAVEAPLLYALVFLSSLILTAALIPRLEQMSSRLGVMDLPIARKVHTRPLPRIGGVAMVVASLVTPLLWMPVDSVAVAYLASVAVLTFFGVWDDRGGLGPWPKLVGQLIAAGLFVVLGSSWLERVPFLDATLPLELAVPVTILFLAASANAVNFSDGLDGLAGGTTLMSLGLVFLLAFDAGCGDLLLFCVVLAGAVLGFLQFNRHPARVFMGDTGSQFLGFSLAVYAIELLKREPNLSPVLMLAIIGWPAFDMAMVVVQRLAERRSIVEGDDSHSHHKLLRLGFSHQGAVFTLYLLHGLMLIAAALSRAESDSTLLVGYLLVCGTAMIVFACVRRTDSGGRRERMAARCAAPLFAAVLIAAICVPLTLVAAAIVAGPVSAQVAGVALGLALLTGLLALAGPLPENVPERMCMLGALTLVVLLLGQSTRTTGVAGVELLLGVIAVAILAQLVLRGSGSLSIAPPDFAAIFAVLMATSVYGGIAGLARALGALIVLVYAGRLLLSAPRWAWMGLRLGILAALLTIAAYGLT